MPPRALGRAARGQRPPPSIRIQWRCPTRLPYTMGRHDSRLPYNARLAITQKHGEKVARKCVAVQTPHHSIKSLLRWWGRIYPPPQKKGAPPPALQSLGEKRCKADASATCFRMPKRYLSCIDAKRTNPTCMSSFDCVSCIYTIVCKWCPGEGSNLRPPD